MQITLVHKKWWTHAMARSSRLAPCQNWDEPHQNLGCSGYVLCTEQHFSTVFWKVCSSEGWYSVEFLVWSFSVDLGDSGDVTWISHKNCDSSKSLRRTIISFFDNLSFLFIIDKSPEQVAVSEFYVTCPGNSPAGIESATCLHAW